MAVAVVGCDHVGGRPAARRSEAAVEGAGDQSGGGGYVFALTDEAAYLQADADEKPETTAERPDPSTFRCWFCRKPHTQVERLFGAEFPVRDRHDFSAETPIFICNECVTKFAGWLAT
jgi:hypothetical protein